MEQDSREDTGLGQPVDWLVTNLFRILVWLFCAISGFCRTLLWIHLAARQQRAQTSSSPLSPLSGALGGFAHALHSFKLVRRAIQRKMAQPNSPFVFVGPAVAILVWYLALPTLRTFWISLFDADNINFVGLQNYAAVFADPDMFAAFRK